MKLLIIEDEQNNADRLVRLVNDIRPDAEIVAVLASNAEVEAFFHQADNAPDVILSDIRLGDGLSFVGLKSAPQSVPVIFTTAYDQYALQAFKYNGLDYLLKPIDAEELRQALDKVVVERTTTTEDIRQLLASAGSIRYRERFLISFRDTFHVVPVSEMSHVGISDGIVRLYTTGGKSHLLNMTLDELEKQLDPERFMRVNRQYIVSAAAVEKLSAHFLGKMRVHLKGYPDTEVIVSREKVSAVKRWLDF
ncbi:MAG: response regulator transcription factor [Bacteroidales bacterium]|nr:response regulator transcription factor [Bacteroidales bacterium]